MWFSEEGLSGKGEGGKQDKAKKELGKSRLWVVIVQLQHDTMGICELYQSWSYIEAKGWHFMLWLVIRFSAFLHRREQLENILSP